MRTAAAFVAGVASVAALGMLPSSVPSEDGAFTACYDRGGAVKFLLDGETECPKGWSGPVMWSQTGPQGPQGEPGADGTDGMDATVPSGTVYGLQVIDGTLNPLVLKTGDYPTGYGLGIATCPDEKHVISANAFIFTGNYVSGAIPLGHEIFNADPTSVLIQWKQYQGTALAASGAIYYELVCGYVSE